MTTPFPSRTHSFLKDLVSAVILPLAVCTSCSHSPNPQAAVNARAALLAQLAQLVQRAPSRAATDKAP